MGAVEVKGSMCDWVGLLMAVTGSETYPGNPGATALRMVGEVETEEEVPSWLGGGLRL